MVRNKYFCAFLDKIGPLFDRQMVCHQFIFKNIFTNFANFKFFQNGWRFLVCSDTFWDLYTAYFLRGLFTV